MNTITDCRSALYMPAVKPHVLAKGPLSAADAIILDLEDAVSPDAKALARGEALKALTELDYGYRIRALRINGAGTPWHADDVAAALKARPDVVVLPKVESPADIRCTSYWMSMLERQTWRSGRWWNPLWQCSMPSPLQSAYRTVRDCRCWSWALTILRGKPICRSVLIVHCCCPG